MLASVAEDAGGTSAFLLTPAIRFASFSNGETFLQYPEPQAWRIRAHCQQRV